MGLISVELFTEQLPGWFWCGCSPSTAFPRAVVLTFHVSPLTHEEIKCSSIIRLDSFVYDVCWEGERRRHVAASLRWHFSDRVRRDHCGNHVQNYKKWVRMDRQRPLNSPVPALRCQPFNWHIRAKPVIYFTTTSQNCLSPANKCFTIDTARSFNQIPLV